jgi:hypothetical protein
LQASMETPDFQAWVGKKFTVDLAY